MTFVPSLRYISGITKSQLAVVTFTEEHTYSNGEILSFRVSKPYGMVEMNNLQGRVLDHDSLSVTMEIDSLGFTAFIDVGQLVPVPALCVPVGSGIVPGLFTATVNLEDVFDNLPPN